MLHCDEGFRSCGKLYRKVERFDKSHRVATNEATIVCFSSSIDLVAIGVSRIHDRLESIYPYIFFASQVSCQPLLQTNPRSIPR